MADDDSSAVEQEPNGKNYVQSLLKIHYKNDLKFSETLKNIPSRHIQYRLTVFSATIKSLTYSCASHVLGSVFITTETI